MNTVTTENKMIKTVYCLYRVSTAGQVDKDDIPMQKQACREFAKNQTGWVIKQEFMEKGISGFKVSADDRDAIQELKAAAERKEFDILLVFMFDRLGRRQNETPFIVEWFAQQGVEVWSAKEGQQRFESEADYLINFMRFWAANGESRKTSMRVKTRLHQLVEEGCYTGGTVPFGYDLVNSGVTNKKGKELKTLAVNPIEASIVQVIFDKTVNEGYGSYVMAEYVNDRKIQTHNGSRFQANTIKRILRNEMYCGFYVRGGVKSPRQEHLQIIDDDTWEQAQRILKQREYKNKEKTQVCARTKSETLLAGNLYCGHCGSKLYASSYNDTYTTANGERKSVKRYRYLCAGRAMHRNECDGQTAYTANKVDTIVLEAMKQCFEKIKATPKDVALEQRYKAELALTRKAIKQLQKETETQKRKLGDLTEEIANALVGDSKFTPDILAVAIEKCKSKISDNAKMIAEKEALFKNQEQIINKLDFHYNQFLSWAKEFDKLNAQEKKMICCSLFKEISISRDYRIEFLMESAYEQFLQDTTQMNVDGKAIVC